MVRLIVHGTGLLIGLAASSHAELPELSIQSPEPFFAFTPAHPPDIELTLTGKSDWHGFIRIERFDLLSEETTVDQLKADVTAGQPGTSHYRPIVPTGIYRIDCECVAGETAPPPSEKPVRVTFAYAPARDPHELPDDWPLGAHVTFEDPPLPGFKWYRYFSSWSQDNPAKDRFDWSRLDKVFTEVRDLGGKLLIANDTTPSWTAPERPVTRPWTVASTAFPPDNMDDLRAYLDAMLRRYDSPAGIIGGLEVWNEANTPSRWQGSPEQMVEMARIFRHAAGESALRVHRDTPARIVGIAVSSGDAQDYVHALIQAGILPCVDIVSGHWYEEMLSYDRATPINSLPLHVDLLAKPMHAAGSSLPIWNTESGIGCVARENGRILTQDELNRRAIASPAFDPRQPWLVDKETWRMVGERRAAASFVAGTVMLMALGVEKTFVYSMRDENWIIDGAPSLSWVALAELGGQIYALNFRQVVPVKAQVTNGNSAIRALAYRIGATGSPGVIVAWTYQLDATVGRPKLWQPWLAPQPVRLEVAAPEAEISDLSGRERKRVAVPNGQVDMNVGEEPVYLRELPPAGQR
jgi:hypothetical protein